MKATLYKHQRICQSIDCYIFSTISLGHVPAVLPEGAQHKWEHSLGNVCPCILSRKGKKECEPLDVQQPHQSQEDPGWHALLEASP